MQSITIPINKVQTTVNSEQNFVIVGANGSGKSHLGACPIFSCPAKYAVENGITVKP